MSKTIRLPEDVYELVKNIADAQRRTVPQQIAIFAEQCGNMQAPTVETPSVSTATPLPVQKPTLDTSDMPFPEFDDMYDAYHHKTIWAELDELSHGEVYFRDVYNHAKAQNMSPDTMNKFIDALNVFGVAFLSEIAEMFEQGRQRLFCQDAANWFNKHDPNFDLSFEERFDKYEKYIDKTK